jgi:hypothetical protein
VRSILLHTQAKARIETVQAGALDILRSGLYNFNSAGCWWVREDDQNDQRKEFQRHFFVVGTGGAFESYNQRRKLKVTVRSNRTIKEEN